MRLLTITTVDWGARKSNNMGATTKPSPKLTVPITVAPTNTMANAAISSRPDSKLGSKQTGSSGFVQCGFHLHHPGSVSLYRNLQLLIRGHRECPFAVQGHG